MPEQIPRLTSKQGNTTQAGTKTGAACSARERSGWNKGRYLPRAGSHWGCQHSPAEMKRLSAAKVTAPSYLIWLSYHLLRRCQPCSIYCSRPLSSARRSAAAFQCLSESNTKE